MATLTPTQDLFFDEAADLGDDDLQAVLGRQATGLQASMDRLREEVREIDDDSALSRQGKRERRAEKVAELRNAVRSAAMLDKLDALRAEAERMRERLFNPKHLLEMEDGDTDRELAAEREIRDHLRRMREREDGDLEVQQTLRQAAREDDRLVLRAVENDPLQGRHPLASEETLREVREEHVRARFPDKLAGVEARERVVDLMATNLQRANEVSREVAGEPVVETGDGDGVSVLHE